MKLRLAFPSVAILTASLAHVVIVPVMIVAPTAQAQLSSVPLRVQSESLRMFKNESRNGDIEIQYIPKGDTAETWTTMLVISRLKIKTPAKDLALDEAEALIKNKKDDRFAAALVMESVSGNSIYLAQVKTVDSVVHSILTRYFTTSEGLVTYKWIRKMPDSRVPADESQKAMQQMRFVERENNRRGDLIIDLGKAGLPLQVKDDPRGMKSVPFRIKINPNSQR